MVTRDDILTGHGARGAHLNYGGGRYGYMYQHVQHPRVAWIDRHGRGFATMPPRIWLVDGVECGEGDAGIDAALLALAKPVELTPAERIVLDVLSTEFANLRKTKGYLAEVLTASGLPEEGCSKAAVFTILHFLRAKGLIEYGREELPPGTVPLPHLNWAPTIRRVLPR